MKKNIAVLGALLLVSGCATQWSDTGKDGVPFVVAEPLCREKARESARHQLPFGAEWQSGAADFPPDSRHDIEARETSLCLMNRGFKLGRK